MQAVRIHGYNHAPTLEEVPIPAIGADQVLVRVAAAVLNPLDGALQTGAIEQVFPLWCSIPSAARPSGSRSRCCDPAVIWFRP